MANSSKAFHRDPSPTPDCGAANAGSRNAEPWVIERGAAHIPPDAAVLLAGRRATVEILLGREGAGRTALAPVDAFNTLDVDLDPAPSLSSVRVTPRAVERKWTFANGGSVTSEWRVDADRPLLRARWRAQAPAGESLQFRLTVQLTSNVGYVNKFAPHEDDRAALTARGVAFTDTIRPNLALRAWGTSTGGAWTLSGRQSARWVREVSAPAAGTQECELYVAASDHPEELDALESVRDLTDGFAVLSGAVEFACPEPELEQFVRACGRMVASNIRTLPLGAPFHENGTANASWDVLTASPDYHGIFANDCIQSLWELGLFGPGLYPCSRNSVETMFRFGPRESVEWWTGDGKVWCFPTPLGDTPQVVMGACWHLLWSGDRALAAAWWPDIRRFLAVLPANDTDGDWLEDRKNTPYPEQPEPGEYDHEMLYVQCFWHQAYRKTAEVAEWLGWADAGELHAIADRIFARIEPTFATTYGLGVWLNRRHEPHPHIGHEQIIAAAQGDVSEACARRIVETMTSAPIWTPDGPLRAEPGKGVRAGDHVWGPMRWKLLSALFRLGECDRAMTWVRQWARQERDLFYAAPEGFPTVTGKTGKNYTWTAARAARAILLGLSGLTLDSGGLKFAPQLPTGWSEYSLARIPVQGSQVTLRVRRGAHRTTINGVQADYPCIRYESLANATVTVIEVAVP